MVISLYIIPSQTKMEIEWFFTWAAMWGPELHQWAKKGIWKIIVFQQIASGV